MIVWYMFAVLVRNTSDFSVQQVNVRVFVSFTTQPTTVMILPQVHLRKPCYDFYFL
jgi:hypothetical protein